MSLLEKGEVFFPTVRQLNDVHEFRPRIRGWKARTSQDKRFDLLTRELLRHYGLDAATWQRFSDAEKEEVVEAHTRNLANLFDEKGFLRPDRMDLISEYFGVLSLTTDPTNVLMWAHYGASNGGVCIGLDTRRGPLSKARPISYVTEPPVIEWENIGTDERVAMFKSTIWAYENEWRVLKRGSGLVTPGPSAIREVIFGFGCDDDAIIEVSRRLVAVKSKARLYRVHRDDAQFRLKKSPISVVHDS